MNITKIKEIVNSDIPMYTMRTEILQLLAKDETAIDNLLEILAFQRKNNKELIADMNLELSRAHIYIVEKSEPKSEEKMSFNRLFVMDSIEKFYTKYKHVISHCFNQFK